MAEKNELKEYLNVADCILYFDGNEIMAGEIIKTTPEKAKVLVDRKLVRELNSKTFTK